MKRPCLFSKRLGLAPALSMLLLVSGHFSQPAEASGSWVASAQGVRVAMAGREVRSAPLAAPPMVPGDARIDSVSWQYRYPAGEAVRAWLCQGETCTSLSAVRGNTQALAGRSTHEPLHFRFALPPGQKRMVEVQGLQLIVNYR